ncbi:MAG: L-threonylcarbamoyladenylate synthase [Acidobacteriota bacterium]
MNTKITQSPSIAARYIAYGEAVAFPTETVYGLGANIFNEEAIRKIFEAKGRPTDNPLIAHIADLSQMTAIARDIPPVAHKLIEAFFPGPLTLVLPKHPKVSLLATAGLQTLGVRMPQHPIAAQFLRACGVPVVAPSANLSGRPSPTTWQAVREDLNGRIACILKSDQTKVGLESTVVDCTGASPLILRAGGVTLEQLRQVVPDTEVANTGDASAPKSPGQKYRHYSPTARVAISRFPQLTAPIGESAYIGLDPPQRQDAFRKVLLCKSVEEYAHSLFQFFRECDEAGVQTIFCQAVSQEGLGLALMDRLSRAANDLR